MNPDRPICIIPNPNVSRGTIFLVKDGHPVWKGSINTPIEDADFDSVILNPKDAQNFAKRNQK